MKALLRNGPFDGKELGDGGDWKCIVITGRDSDHQAVIYKPRGYMSADGLPIFDYEGPQ